MAQPLLPYAFASRHRVLLLSFEDGRAECLHVAGVVLTALLEVQRIAGRELAFSEIPEDVFAVRLGQIYRDNASDAADVAAADSDLARLADTAAAVDDLLDQRDDAPVVRLINALLSEAIKESASDIHIETQEKRLIVRFRIDGLLRDMIEPKRSLAPLLISRIKVMARLDIAEKRMPQDGRVSLRVGGHEIDVRVSTIPSQYGERVVLRILDRGTADLDIADIGLTPHDVSILERLLRRPAGILLVTGPTGSGKTTTLYAALRRLNDRKRNIMTVEDPIEYAVDGVGQTQINPRIDLTFARGLRAILRQDPDVIMVGEIRDQETAQAAVQASMTGHFVLSTLHTNSAIGTVTRLRDMGIERFMLAPTLAGLIAQRLVRVLCKDCREPGKATRIESDMVGGHLPVGAPVFRAVGCPACGGQGYRGRTGVYEVVEINADLEALIHAGAAESDLVASARRGSVSLLQDGINKVLSGVTSVDEIARVALED